MAAITRQDTDLRPVLRKSGCYGLNLAGGATFDTLLNDDPNLVVRSDADDELLVGFEFDSPVTLTRVKVIGGAKWIAARSRAGGGGDDDDDDEIALPTRLAVFINRPSMGFDDFPRDAEFDLTPEQLEPDAPALVMPPRGFERVTHVHFLFTNGDADAVVLSHVRMFGVSKEAMDLGQLKAVGKEEQG